MKKVWWIIGGSAAVLLFMKRKKITQEMKDLTLNLNALIVKGLAKIRKDSAGDGHYGASRSGGTRKHAGLDLIIIPGQTINAPFNARIIREAYPYKSDLSYHGIYIESTDHKDLKMKMFYLKKLSNLKNGDLVKKGSPIAKAENIAAKYSKSMTPHIHVEVYENRVRVNPEKYLKA